MNTHSATTEEIFKELSTSHQGLSDEEAQKRLKIFGKNAIEEEKTSKLKIFLRQFNDVFVYILVAAALISILLGELRDFFIINSIIIINSLIGYLQEIKAEMSIAALKKLTESKNTVLRNGKLTQICSSEIVPGDILIVHEGDLITSDVRLIKSSSMMIDESTLTGESVPVTKDHMALVEEKALPFEWKNMLMTGTSVVRGSGEGVVVKTGKNSYFASIAVQAKSNSFSTPLTKSIKYFSMRYAVILVLLFSLICSIGYFQGRKLLDLFYVLLAGLVAAVPEGLPIVITLVLVVGAITLSKRKTLIRYLPSVETLGSTTVIASDKTGTITEGKLIIKEIYAPDLEKLKIIAALCNDARGNAGDPMDKALLNWVENHEDIRKKYPREWHYPFNVNLMLMASVNAQNLFVKGAFESLKEMEETRDEKLETIANDFMQRGLRVISFGDGKWNENEDPRTWKIKIRGLIGFLDPPKEGVKETVSLAQKAGISIMMITGDHPITAKRIAEEVGINGEKILTGKEIEKTSDEELLEKLKHTSTFARILPEHKYRIVKLLQQKKEIVAVTGDGVNDVPALRIADIGIAMGGGTEAAKSAAKMIITDNNLSTIVEAIKSGRIIVDNIRKAIYYLVSISLQLICLITLSTFSSIPIPLTAIQILWINIIAESMQDKCFPFAKEEGSVMNRKPRNPKKQFFNSSQVRSILLFGIIMGTASFFLYLHLLGHYSFTTASSIVFTSIISAQWANGIQAQKESEPFFKNIRKSFTINPLIFLGFGLGFFLQCFTTHFIPELFHSAEMGIEEWKYPALMFLFSFLFVELKKWCKL